MLEKLGGDASLMMVCFLKFPPNRKQRVLEHQDRRDVFVLLAHRDAMPLAHRDVVVLLVLLVADKEVGAFLSTFGYVVLFLLHCAKVETCVVQIPRWLLPFLLYLMVSVRSRIKVSAIGQCVE